jgi:hypothetical protein
MALSSPCTRLRGHGAIRAGRRRVSGESPVTALGRVLAAVIAVFGIGMVALPAGIIGSGFVEEIQRRRTHRRQSCPHYGKPLKPQDREP